ncbi:MAG: hypothetical protein ACRC9I_13050 [Acinetobacter sp.]
MAYVCETLSNPAFITGQQTCNKWVVLEQQQSNSFLPNLTAADKDSLLIWFIGIFVVVFTLKKILKLFSI